MTLKTKLSPVNQVNKGINEYLQAVKGLADELAMAQASVTDDDPVIIGLNGVNQEFHLICTTLHGRETSTSYEELHEKLTEFEAVLKQQQAYRMSVNFVRRNKGPSSNQYRSINNSNNRSNRSIELWRHQFRLLR